MMMLVSSVLIIAYFMQEDTNEAGNTSMGNPTGSEPAQDVSLPTTSQAEQGNARVVQTTKFAQTPDAVPLSPEELMAPIQLTPAQTRAWLEGKSGDRSMLLESVAIGGLVSNNPDLVRHAVRNDPENPKLAYLGATNEAFTREEQLEHSKQFYLNAPENGLAGFIYAARLYESGDPTAAIRILEESRERHLIDDFSLDRQLLMEEAYQATGASAIKAKLQATISSAKPYLRDLLAFAGEFDDLADSLPKEEAAQLRGHAASMGVRLRKSAEAGTIIDQLGGLAIEARALDGLGEEDVSPYESLTIPQAQEALKLKKIGIQETLKLFDMGSIALSSPEVLGEFVDKVREVGELEAIKWFHRKRQH
jgi:hypothetical protein